MEQWGFRTPRTRTHPISHPTLISHIAWQRIAVRPGIAAIEGDAVHFVDGSTEHFDSIIAATDYTTQFPNLPAEHWLLNGTTLDLYNRVVHPSLPGLFFIGFFDVSGGSNIRMMDDQGTYIAAVAAGAGGGIGRAIALRLAREGCDVGMFDIDATGATATAELIRAAGRRAPGGDRHRQRGAPRRGNTGHRRTVRRVRSGRYPGQ
jgi:hypothetical protein